MYVCMCRVCGRLNGASAAIHNGLEEGNKDAYLAFSEMTVFWHWFGGMPLSLVQIFMVENESSCCFFVKGHHKLHMCGWKCGQQIPVFSSMKRWFVYSGNDQMLACLYDKLRIARMPGDFDFSLGLNRPYLSVISTPKTDLSIMRERKCDIITFIL